MKAIVELKKDIVRDLIQDYFKKQTGTEFSCAKIAIEFEDENMTEISRFIAEIDLEKHCPSFKTEKNQRSEPLGPSNNDIIEDCEFCKEVGNHASNKKLFDFPQKPLGMLPGCSRLNRSYDAKTSKCRKCEYAKRCRSMLGKYLQSALCLLNDLEFVVKKPACFGMGSNKRLVRCKHCAITEYCDLQRAISLDSKKMAA